MTTSGRDGSGITIVLLIVLVVFVVFFSMKRAEAPTTTTTTTTTTIKAEPRVMKQEVPTPPPPPPLPPVVTQAPPVSRPVHVPEATSPDKTPLRNVIDRLVKLWSAKRNEQDTSDKITCLTQLRTNPSIKCDMKVQDMSTLYSTAYVYNLERDIYEQLPKQLTTVGGNGALDDVIVQLLISRRDKKELNDTLRNNVKRHIETTFADWIEMSREAGVESEETSTMRQMKILSKIIVALHVSSDHTKPDNTLVTKEFRQKILTILHDIAANRDTNELKHAYPGSFALLTAVLGGERGNMMHLWTKIVMGGMREFNDKLLSTKNDQMENWAIGLKTAEKLYDNSAAFPIVQTKEGVQEIQVTAREIEAFGALERTTRTTPSLKRRIAANYGQTMYYALLPIDHTSATLTYDQVLTFVANLLDRPIAGVRRSLGDGVGAMCYGRGQYDQNRVLGSNRCLIRETDNSIMCKQAYVCRTDVDDSVLLGEFVTILETHHDRPKVQKQMFALEAVSDISPPSVASLKALPLPMALFLSSVSRDLNKHKLALEKHVHDGTDLLKSSLSLKSLTKLHEHALALWQEVRKEWRFGLNEAEEIALAWTIFANVDETHFRTRFQLQGRSLTDDTLQKLYANKSLSVMKETVIGYILERWVNLHYQEEKCRENSEMLTAFNAYRDSASVFIVDFALAKMDGKRRLDAYQKFTRTNRLVVETTSIAKRLNIDMSQLKTYDTKMIRVLEQSVDLMFTFRMGLRMERFEGETTVSLRVDRGEKTKARKTVETGQSELALFQLAKNKLETGCHTLEVALNDSRGKLIEMELNTQYVTDLKLMCMRSKGKRHTIYLDGELKTNIFEPETARLTGVIGQVYLGTNERSVDDELVKNLIRGRKGETNMMKIEIAGNRKRLVMPSLEELEQMKGSRREAVFDGAKLNEIECRGFEKSEDSYWTCIEGIRVE